MTQRTNRQTETMEARYIDFLARTQKPSSEPEKTEVLLHIDENGALVVKTRYSGISS